MSFQISESGSTASQSTGQQPSRATAPATTTTAAIAQNTLQKVIAQPVTQHITSQVTALQTTQHTQELNAWNTLIEHFIPSLGSNEKASLATQLVNAKYPNPTIADLQPFCDAACDENNPLTPELFSEIVAAFKVFSLPLLKDDDVRLLLSFDFAGAMIQKVYDKISDPQSKSLLARFTHMHVQPPVTMHMLTSAQKRGENLLTKFNARKTKSPQEHLEILEKALKYLPIKEQQEYTTELQLTQCETDTISLSGFSDLLRPKVQRQLSDKEKEIIINAAKRTPCMQQLYVSNRKKFPKTTVEDRLRCVDAAVRYLQSIQPNISLRELQEELQANRDPFQGHALFFIIDGVRSNASIYPRCFDIKSKNPSLSLLKAISQSIAELMTIQKSIASLSLDALEKVLVQDLYPSEVNFIYNEAIKNRAIFERYTQLRIAHPKWNVQATLQRAVRQLAQIEKLRTNADISLGEISGLLRRHLSTAEDKKLCDIVTAHRGTQAQKIAAKLQNMTLQQSVDSLIQELVDKESITYADVQLLKGVKLTETQTSNLMTHINQQITRTQDANLKALVSVCEDIRSNWTLSEESEPSLDVVVSIALYVDSYFRELAPTTQVAERILFPAFTHVRRSLAVTATGIHILSRKRVRLELGKGTSKRAEAVMSLFTKRAPSSTVTASPPSIYASPGVRLIANTPHNVQEIVRDVAFAKPFENETGFLHCHGVIQCTRKTKPKISAFYDRCDGPIHKNDLSVEQKIQVVREVLTAVAALHAQGVYHFDLKPDNILCIIDENGKANGFLIDFNLSGKKPRVETYDQGFYGSYVYTPPELLSHTGTTFTGDHAACENFALGTTLYLMLHPEKTFAPWEEEVYNLYQKTTNKQTAISTLNSELAKYHRQNAPIVQRAESSQPMTQQQVIEYIIDGLLIANHNERWTASEALQILNDLLPPSLQTSIITQSTTIPAQTTAAQQIDRSRTAPPPSTLQQPPTAML